jgi:hypothetical protein
MVYDLELPMNQRLTIAIKVTVFNFQDHGALNK